ncbi:MAG TPA: hypothetical protein VLD83_17020, partial [Candidatus Binatia bacterium]|nr:hypothetical protein [Candidatus Binatia bacterium]
VFGKSPGKQLSSAAHADHDQRQGSDRISQPTLHGVLLKLHMAPQKSPVKTINGNKAANTNRTRCELSFVGRLNKPLSLLRRLITRRESQHRACLAWAIS